ncbi:MAG: hypothetical protein ACR2OC_01935 [Solirubrobacterales bacterium]
MNALLRQPGGFEGFFAGGKRLDALDEAIPHRHQLRPPLAHWDAATRPTPLRLTAGTQAARSILSIGFYRRRAEALEAAGLSE